MIEERLCIINSHSFNKGYFELKVKKRFSFLKRNVSWLARSHIESRRGTAKEAYDYCTKEDTRVKGPFTLGQSWQCLEEKKAGRSKIFGEIVDLIWKGTRLSEIAEMDEYKECYARHHKCFAAAAEMYLCNSVPSWRDVEVILFVGPTHTGKTRMAMELAEVYGGPKGYYVIDATNNNTVWFDGYDGQEVLVIDDYQGWIKFRTLLRILDGYRIRLERKGGFVYAKYKKILITSNVMPEEWYQKVPDISPMIRRIHSLITISNLLYEDLKPVMWQGCRLIYEPADLSFGQIARIKERWTAEKAAAMDTVDTPAIDPVPGPCLPRCDATLTAGQGDPMDSQVTNESQSSVVFIDDE